MRLVTSNNQSAPVINQRLRMQKAYRAANSMMLQLRIQQGDQLLFVLGYTSAHDNKDAICRWILDNDNSGVLSMESYRELKNRLQEILSDSVLGGFNSFE